MIATAAGHKRRFAWVAALALSASACTTAGAVTGPSRPNIVVVMTDDLDVASVVSMPNLRRLLSRAGTTFARHTVSYSLCCPSRATYLGGQLSHNNGVRANVPPEGGYARLDAAQTLPVWLSKAGYVTSHLGKYPNGYNLSRHVRSRGVPPGWTEWNGALDPTTYRYYEYVLNEDGVPVMHGVLPSEYQTDVLTAKAVDFIERRSSGKRPFFLDIAYLAPHSETRPGSRPDIDLEAMEGSIDNKSTCCSPPLPALRHAKLFARARAPRPPSFNEKDVSDKPSHVRSRAPLTAEEIAAIDRWYRARLRSLQAVDEGVAAIVRALERADALGKTYIIFTTDNGWQQGEHRIDLRKVDVYEPSTRIPLIVRGPGVRRNATVRDWTSNVDIHATVLALARAGRPKATFPIDGRSLVPYLSAPDLVTGRAVLHEAFGEPRVSYAAVRAGRWKWVEYLNGERELYDFASDPHELRSLHRSSGTARVRSHLSDLLDELRSCRGADCVVEGYFDGWPNS